MRCYVCGSEVNQGATFCPVCGSELSSNSNASSVSDGIAGANSNIPQVPGLITPYGKSGTIPSNAVPTSEMPTTRVTVEGDTDELIAKNDEHVVKLKTQKEKNKYHVQARPKRLALKIVLLILFLVGVGAGVFYGIRFLKTMMENAATFKKFTADQVEKAADKAEYVCGQILLKARKGVSENRIKKLAEEKRGSIVGKIPITNDYQIEFENRKMQEDELKLIIEEWKQKSDLVVSAQLHYAYGTEGGFKYTDNPWKDDSDENSSYGDELVWDMDHPAGNNWAVESIWAPKVWDSLEYTEYQQIEVGVIDTVFDSDHRDLTNRFAPLKDEETLIEGNPQDSNGDSTVKEEYAPYIGSYDSKRVNPNEKRLMHGTHVSGIIAANMDDDFGIAGVAQNAKLHGYAMSGSYDTDEEITYSSAFEWKYALSKMMESGIRLINVSMQIDIGDQDEISMKDINEDMDEFLQACIDEDYDFLLIKSAGDDKLQDFDNVFLAGITTQSVKDRIIVVGGAKCKYSESGELKGYTKTNSTNYGKRIDIYAPGPNILSDIPGDRTEKRSGTSGSAAFVTGACSLIMGFLPKATMSEVKSIVLNSYYDTVTVTVQLNGMDRNYVRGYLNVYWATEAARKSNLNQDDKDSTGAVESEVIVDGKTIEEWMVGNRPLRQEETDIEENTEEQMVNKDWIDGYLRFFDETAADGSTFNGADAGAFSKARVLYINEDTIPELVILLKPDDSVMVATWNDTEKRVDYIILEKRDPEYLIQIKEGTNKIWYLYDYVIKGYTFFGYETEEVKYVVEYYQICDGRIQSIAKESFATIEEADSYTDSLGSGDPDIGSIFGMKSVKAEYSDWDAKKNYTLNSVEELINWIKEQ